MREHNLCQDICKNPAVEDGGFTSPNTAVKDYC